VRFGVHRDCPRSRVQASLFRGICDRSIRADDIGVDRTWKRFDKCPCPAAIGGKAFTIGSHAGAHDPVARNQVGRQSTGDPKADDARSAALGRPVEGSDKL